MSKVLTQFFDQQSEEEKKIGQAAVDNAREENALKLGRSGHYLMEVGTFAWPDKDTGKMCVSPDLSISTKNSLMTTISLRVVDGTPEVPKGSSIFTNIVLSPAKGASKEKFDKTMRMMKPQIVALTGQKNIQFTPEWIEEYLSATFDDVDGKFILVKDHKMKNKVMVVVEDGIYNDKETLNVASIRKAGEGEKSRTNPLPEDSTPQEVDVSAEDINPDEEVISNTDPGSAQTQETVQNSLDSVVPEKTTVIPDVPGAPEDF